MSTEPYVLILLINFVALVFMGLCMIGSWITGAKIFEKLSSIALSMLLLMLLTSVYLMIEMF